MSDAAAERFKSESPTTPPPPQGRSVTLAITLHPNGQIDFQLPLNNKIVCYGLLEAARAQADKLYLMEESKQAQATHQGISGLMKRMNGGRT